MIIARVKSVFGAMSIGRKEIDWKVERSRICSYVPRGIAAKRGHPHQRPIRINLRMDELRIANQLVGIGLLTPGVDMTSFPHGSRDSINHSRERHLSYQCKAQHTCSPLRHLLGFTQTALRVLPATQNSHPMLDK